MYRWEVGMIRVNVTELRNNLPFFLSRVSAGEEVQVTRRGKVIARISPVVAREEARRELEELRKNARINDVESPLDAVWEAGE
jgi:prevent-host-death family protein